MQDPFDALRRAYGEPDALPERPAPEVQAEVDTYSTLKSGLDALPPQRPDAAALSAVLAAAETTAALDALPSRSPDAATLATVFAAAEAAPLASVRAVYEEESPVLDTAEAATFAALKSGLDALPPQRPEATILDAVVAAAAAPPSVAAPDQLLRRSADRAPQRLVTRRRLVVAASAAFALTLVLTSGLWFPNSGLPTPATEEQLAQAAEPGEQAKMEAEEESMASEDAFLADAQPVPPSTPSGVESRTQSGTRSVAPRAAQAPPVQASPSAALASSARQRAPETAPAPPVDADLRVDSEGAGAESFAAGNLADADQGDLVLASDEALPLADGEEALRQLYLRTLQLQAAQAGLGWDGPPDALGAAPDSLPTATGWMQVRVER